MAIKQLPSDGWPGGQRPETGAPLPSSLQPGGDADSAGFTWEGRTFEHHDTAFANDDGETPTELQEAVLRIRETLKELQNAAGASEQSRLLGALAEAQAEAIAVAASVRLLVPLIAKAGDYGLTPEGRVVEKTQELSIVTVEASDGRQVLPVFSSVETMQNWNPVARPIPVPGVQVALAAGQEQTDLVIIDAGTAASEFGIRRTALQAFALGQPHKPAWANSAVAAALESICGSIEDVVSVTLAPGDASARLLGPETIAAIKLRDGLNKAELAAVAATIQERIAQNETIAEQVDSLSLKFV